MFNYELYKRHTLLSPKTNHGYIECIYTTTSASTTVRLFGQSFRLYKIRKLEIDGVECGPSYDYIFSSPGDHVVKVYIGDRITGEDYIFEECDKLKSVKFFIDENFPFSIGTSTFNNCTSLVSVDWNNSPIVFSANGSLFANCTKLTNIDLIKPTINSSSFTSTFRNADSLSSIVFPKIDNASFTYTFIEITNPNIEVDLSNITKISWWNAPLQNTIVFKKLNFGECDLSTAVFDDYPFLCYWLNNVEGEVILLGAPMNYKGWIGAYNASYSGFKGTVIYNLEYDYSDFFIENPNCTAVANKSVNKTLKIRFCTNDNWLTGSSHEFKINNVVGTYTGQGIYEFPIVADTYKYPIYYNNVEIGTAIVKDDIQQICFGNNPSVYKVIDFSSETSFDPSIIKSNENWSFGIDSNYFGLHNPTISNGESTSVTLNTGMIGDIHLTLAQSSQTNYHYCTIKNNNTTLKNLKGERYQSHFIKGVVNTNDGNLTFKYGKMADTVGKDPISKRGYDKFYIKKLENYNWPELPA